MQAMSRVGQLGQLRKKIKLRERAPVWGLRLVLGFILFTLSELVMWQNPPSRSLIEWPILLVMYVALAALLMDMIVRFQVNTPAAFVLACAVYGLATAIIINHSAFDGINENPYRLIVRGLGLQTAAGLYGTLLFISVMHGRQITVLHLVGAVAVGLLWGIWVHWYPIQPRLDWGLVSIESASIYVIPALFVIGALFAFIAPRFQFVREMQLELLWWEAILVIIPLFLTLLIGMAQDLILFFPLILFLVLGAFMVWALWYQREGTDPSYLAEITFTAPNMISYIVLAIAFLLAGTIAYTFVDNVDSVIGIATYWIAFAFGSLGLPVAVILIFWRVFKRETKSVKQEVLEEMLKDLNKKESENGTR